MRQPSTVRLASAILVVGLCIARLTPASPLIPVHPEETDALRAEIGALNDNEARPEAKIAACDELKRLGPAAHAADAALVRSLERPGAVREHASAALQAIGREAVSPLIDAISGHGLNRYVAADVLGRMGEAALPAVPRIISLLDDNEETTVVLACQALEGLGPRALPAASALRRKLRSPAVAIRYGALSALLSIDRQCDPAVLHAIVNIDHAGTFYRIKAAETLAAAGEKANLAIPDLVILGTEDSTDLVRDIVSRAISAAGPIKKQTAADLAESFTAEKYDPANPIHRAQVRRTLLELLCAPGAEPDPAFPWMLAELQSEEVGDDAAAALCRLGSRASTLTPALVSMVHASPSGRQRALRVLGSVASREGGGLQRASLLATVTPFLQDPDQALAASAADALAHLGWPYAPAIKPLMAMIEAKSSSEMSAARALAAMGPDVAEAMPVLLKAVAENKPSAEESDQRKELRAALGQAIGRIAPDSKEAADLLLTAVKQQDWTLRENLAPLLSHRADKEQRLIPALKDLAEHDPVELVRVNARCALRELDSNRPGEK